MNGTLVAARLLHHCRSILDIPLSFTFGWTDSTIVLSWLHGDSTRFKPFMGNRVARRVELIPASEWQHVPGISNPADQASRGLFPPEFAASELWRKGPEWLHLPKEEWPEIPKLLEKLVPVEEKESSQKAFVAAAQAELPLLE